LVTPFAVVRGIYPDNIEGLKLRTGHSPPYTFIQTFVVY
jgi:hypothetical protein